ncbi:MAG: hypothetical protein ACRD2X_15695 [Vicinamibacteraceae bacterium]
MNVLRRWIGAVKNRPTAGTPDITQLQPDMQRLRPSIRMDVSGDTALATVDLDELDVEEQPLLVEELTRRSDVPSFEGTVEHGYAVRAVGSFAQCPRCNAATRQQIANFIYATDISPRVMLAPAGYFCTACPTVIVDEDLIARGMKEGYHFRAVVGLDHGGAKPPDLFVTWNGREPTYILDEEERVIDMVSADQLRLEGRMHRESPRRDEPTQKRRRKMAQQSRKRNRR